MAISASQFGAILAPGLTKMFSGTFGPPVFYTVSWRALYDREYRQVHAERDRVERLQRWEEFLTRHKPTVAARLRVLNPNGWEEGAVPRGIHHKDPDRFIFDIIPAHKYVKKWGTEPDRIAFRRGRKKFVSGQKYIQGPSDWSPCPNPGCCQPLGHADECREVPF